VAGSPWSRIECVQGDLVRERVDAIVNAANTRLAGGGGVDGAIHRAAGPGLLAECRERWPEGGPTGEARITSGHRLPARHVIHAVGPVWNGGGRGEAELLARCHEVALRLAAEHGLRTVSFPAISSRAYGYPLEQAAEGALPATAAALAEEPSLERVRFVLFGEEQRAVWSAVLERLARERGGNEREGPA
jgi:O-acetyl-ADP-ribose deacetylase (regulator of RNase III)